MIERPPRVAFVAAPGEIMGAENDIGRAEGDSVTSLPERVARELLTAYHYQDEREWFLIEGDPDRARTAASQALAHMSSVFSHEFPELPEADAGASGEAFMEGLFLQDEIENWEEISANRLAIQDELVCTAITEPTSQLTDERWDLVRDRLDRTCRILDMDPAFGAKQTEFWRLHGQQMVGWRDAARDAQEVKLERMLTDPAPGTVAHLADLFVEGVERHDSWTPTDRSRDIAATVDPVIEYYQTVYDRQAPTTESR
ncbi:MAG: hypothetical protein U5K37_03175 [Natrialbaceae archaeon]|nr:hypothetical protein [Natrialbaceae archaeon]